MKVTRRDFMKYCTGSAAALWLTQVLSPLEKALASSSGPPIIWLQGAACSGCTVSLANRISTSAPVDLADLLINTIDLVYHPTLMGAAGEPAAELLLKASAEKFVLVVEGGIPTLYNGKTCQIYTHNGVDVTLLETVRTLAPKAVAVLAVGTCASFGGIPAGKPNPTQIEGLGKAAGVPVINVSGCPPHPDWIVWTIAQLLAGNKPELDAQFRPTAIYGNTIHSKCPRIDKPWAESLSSTGLCNAALGCKGQQTFADCPTRMWNNQMNWCIGGLSSSGNGADSLCQGCTESGFPDNFAPLFSPKGATPLEHVVYSKPNCAVCHPDGRPDLPAVQK